MEVRYIEVRNETNPRYLCQEWSREMSRVRVTEEDHDLAPYPRMVDESTSDASSPQLSYEWFRKGLLRTGLAFLNETEIVVGKHVERRRVLRVREEELRAKGTCSKSYTPRM